MKVKKENVFFSIDNLIRSVFLFIIFSSVIGCTAPEEKRVQVPSNLLDQEEFITVLTDIELLEAQYTQKLYKDKWMKFMIKDLYAKKLEEYDLSESDFKENYTYYSKQNEVMDKIYEGVFLKLDSMETALKELK